MLLVEGYVLLLEVIEIVPPLVEPLVGGDQLLFELKPRLDLG